MVEASTPCVHDSFKYALLTHGCIHVRIQKIYSKNKCIAPLVQAKHLLQGYFFQRCDVQANMVATGVSTPGVIF